MRIGRFADLSTCLRAARRSPSGGSRTAEPFASPRCPRYEAGRNATTRVPNIEAIFAEEADVSGPEAQGERAVTATAGPLDAFIDAGTSLLGLPIEPAWKPAIRAHLDVTLGLAALLTAFELPEHVEPAPVYRASDDAGA